MVYTYILIGLLVLAIMAAILFAFSALTLSKTNKELKTNYNTILSQKKSSEVRVGQIAENLAPFLKDFKYNPKKAHFMGAPIDYVVFEDDKVIFLEIKSGKSRLSKGQQNIKKLVEDGKVVWETMRIE